MEIIPTKGTVLYWNAILCRYHNLVQALEEYNDADTKVERAVKRERPLVYQEKIEAWRKVASHYHAYHQSVVALVDGLMSGYTDMTATSAKIPFEHSPFLNINGTKKAWVECQTSVKNAAHIQSLKEKITYWMTDVDAIDIDENGTVTATPEIADAIREIRNASVQKKQAEKLYDCLTQDIYHADVGRADDQPRKKRRSIMLQ